MAGKRNRYVGGGTGAIIAAVWSAYSNFTTARDLGDDAGGIARMIADPPVYAPWLLLLGCILFLAWVFWDRDSDDGDSSDMRQNSTGPNSPNVGTNSGTVHITYGSLQPAESKQDSYRYELNERNLDGLERALTKKKTVKGSNNRVNYGSISGDANFGDTHFYEPPARVAPPDTFSRVYDGHLTAVYIRPYESVAERTNFAASLAKAFKKRGINATLQTGYIGQEPLDGVIVKPGSNTQKGLKIAQHVAQSINDVGFKTEIGDPVEWDRDDQLLILIGGKE